MKQMTGQFLERCRIRTGRYASDRSLGFNGAFEIPWGKITFRVICSDGAGWEHVSVSLPLRCPTWEEMCYVKDLFWDEHECVMQLHPPKSEYVNNCPTCLHLWRPTSQLIPMPDSILVGVKSVGVLG